MSIDLTSVGPNCVLRPYKNLLSKHVLMKWKSSEKPLFRYFLSHAHTVI